MKELQLSLSKWEERVNEKKTENENLQKYWTNQYYNYLDRQITHLQSKTDDRIRIIEAQGSLYNVIKSDFVLGAKGKDANLDNVLARRRLTQLSRSQTRDIEVLTKQLHTLREKNYPSLQPLK